MNPTSTATTPIISVLQTAVSPVILISGVGLLLLTMTNRLGRAIDRARSLASVENFARPEILAQIGVLMRRAHILRRAILLLVTSALTTGVLVISIFLMVLFELDLSGLIALLFVIGILSLIAALVLLMWDVNLSLSAIEEKLGAQTK